MEKNKCGNCFWFTRVVNIYNFNKYYCKLHYMQEARHKDETACSDFQERGKDGED